MADEAQHLVRTAEEHLHRGQLPDAARCLEEAAATAGSKAEAARLLANAAETYARARSTEDAGRCYRQAGQLLGGDDKAECLMAYWRSLILAIAGCEYDCGYEWRGDTSGAHDADHDHYQGRIGQHEEEAARVLAEVLHIEGIDRRRIIKRAQKECRERGRDGWGAGVCARIIAEVIGKGAD